MLFTERLKDVWKVKGKDAPSGRDAWWIIRVHPHKRVLFSVRIPKGHLDLADYGEILASGFGPDIPPEILKRYGLE